MYKRQLLDDLAFGETRLEGGIDLPAASYNLGFDLAPGDCTAEVPFVAPVTEAVTSVLVAVDQDTGAGLDAQVWALVDAETVVALINPDPCDGVVCDATDCSEGVCNPSTGLCEDENINEGGDCDGGTGTCDMGICVDKCEGVVCEEADQCQVNACNPLTGLCETMNEADGAECSCPTCGAEGMCEAGICVPNPEVVYEQNFDELNIAGGIIGDSWFFFNNVFDAGDTLLFSYNNPLQLAPNATIDPDNIFISALVDDQGNGEQGTQQLSVFSDYNCCQPSSGHINGTDKVEVNVLRDVFTAGDPIAAGDIGKTVTFAFQAKRGNIEAPTTALGYIKTLDPSANFAQTNFVIAETTNVGTDWTPLTVSLPLTDAALVGQVLQIGFQNTASDFAGSGVFYDNVVVTLE